MTSLRLSKATNRYFIEETAIARVRTFVHACMMSNLCGLTLYVDDASASSALMNLVMKASGNAFMC